MSRKISLHVATVLGLTGIIVSCLAPTGTELVVPTATQGDMFNSYVAIGNSVTAGYQSQGITDSTQRRSYALLLAQSMGTRYAYPSIATPGCPPLIASFLTQLRTVGTGTTCGLRAVPSADILNNVAVPGATSLDPTSTSTAASNTLTTLFLGGKTQVERALMANPTFVTIWIGNNDVLGPVVSNGGTTGGPTPSLPAITSQTQFQTNYAAMLNPLKAQNGNLKGVLLGVINVANLPVMFPAAAFANAQFKGGFDQIACGTVLAPAPTSTCNATKQTVIDASCNSAPGNTALINMFLAFQMRTGAYGTNIIACARGGASGGLPYPIGDALILDPGEQTTVAAAVTGYNTYIKAKADSAGFLFYDPNPTLLALRALGTAITNIPNLASGTATFGTQMSNDGVHPAAAIHLTLANALITLINTAPAAKSSDGGYGTKLPTVF
jgi:hypothetical protein